MLSQGACDLQRRQHQAARCMQDYINWHLRIGHADGTQNLLGVIDIDIAKDRETQQSHGLLPMDPPDDSRIALTPQARDSALSRGFKCLLTYDRLYRRRDEEHPEEKPEEVAGIVRHSD